VLTWKTEFIRVHQNQERMVKRRVIKSEAQAVKEMKAAGLNLERNNDDLPVARYGLY